MLFCQSSTLPRPSSFSPFHPCFLSFKRCLALSLIHTRTRKRTQINTQAKAAATHHLPPLPRILHHMPHPHPHEIGLAPLSATQNSIRDTHSPTPVVGLTATDRDTPSTPPARHHIHAPAMTLLSHNCSGGRGDGGRGGAERERRTVTVACGVEVERLRRLVLTASVSPRIVSLAGDTGGTGGGCDGVGDGARMYENSKTRHTREMRGQWAQVESCLLAIRRSCGTTATHCNTLQHTATHTATHYNTMGAR